MRISFLRLRFAWCVVLFGALPLVGAAGDPPVGFVREAASVTPFDAGDAPSEPYRFVDRFPGLTFDQPVRFKAPPGENNRLFVIELPGRVRVMPDLAVPSSELALDLTHKVIYGGESGLLGLAFHPGFAQNGHLFLFYSSNEGGPLFNVLSRFTIAADNPSRIDPDSEVILIKQRDENVLHNAGDIHFGPDGYLYVSVGDEGGANGQFGNAQRIDRDLFSGILRIDVDGRPGNTSPNPHPAVVGPYWIPADNPFVALSTMTDPQNPPLFNGLPIDPTAVRTEFYAVGLRNSFRMAFDSVTGRLFAGDVGQSAYEEVNEIVSGGNYGWNLRTAIFPTPFAPETPPVFNHIEPFYSFKHDLPMFDGIANAMIGGTFYHGERFPELQGRFIFADLYSSVAALSVTGPDAGTAVALTREPLSISFGPDPATGELLVSKLDEGTIKELVAALPEPVPKPLLSQTGFFQTLAPLVPATGVVPYEVNLPFWSDGAAKRRYLVMPSTEAMITVDSTRPAAPWSVPNGAFLIKHFDLDGVSIETRVMYRREDGWFAWTYEWQADGRDAVLVDSEGVDRQLSPGAPPWRYPSRQECFDCHRTSRGTLSLTPAQLNRSGSGFSAFGPGNQVEVLRAHGFFGASDVPAATTLPRLATPQQAGVSLHYRARSWLEVNCAFCHFPGGVGAQWDGRINTPLVEANIVLGDLRGVDTPSSHVVVPGQPGQSDLLYRMSTRTAAAMPPVGSNRVDEEARDLLTEWINALQSGVPGEGVEVPLVGRDGRVLANVPAHASAQLECAPSLDEPWRGVSEWRFPGSESELFEQAVELEDARTFYRLRLFGF